MLESQHLEFILGKNYKESNNNKVGKVKKFNNQEIIILIFIHLFQGL
jgi:hypothetical protein